MSAVPALDVRGLTTRFDTRAGTVTAVHDVSFQVAPGRIVGLVGESGSGKSVTGFSILDLIDEPGHIDAGRIAIEGTDLRALPPAACAGCAGARSRWCSRAR